MMDDEFAHAYKEYRAFLKDNDLYDHTPALIEISRGDQIDHIGDFSILGKMAARNHRFYIYRFIDFQMFW
ncbi:hypothetical protein EFK13_13750 [Bacillus cabrialesii]|uniref:hypothetical protein n=1 Tax=Bacillus cabrialesii TaxID=2487276 RepID=UPI00200C7CC9|nr:hypothetical protein [Bacillus cabrialesii]UQE77825.1 hypothetical protein EFK13_13750 [Bacillus cabrialesii]